MNYLNYQSIITYELQYLYREMYILLYILYLVFKKFVGNIDFLFCFYLQRRFPHSITQ